MVLELTEVKILQNREIWQHCIRGIFFRLKQEICWRQHFRIAVIRLVAFGVGDGGGGGGGVLGQPSDLLKELGEGRLKQIFFVTIIY